MYNQVFFYAIGKYNQRLYTFPLHKNPPEDAHERKKVYVTSWLHSVRKDDKVPHEWGIQGAEDDFVIFVLEIFTNLLPYLIKSIKIYYRKK